MVHRVAEGHGEGVAGVEVFGRRVHAELEAEHLAHLPLLALAVAGDHLLHAGGRIVEDGQAGQRGREHRDGAGFADGHGGADVLADERLLDGDDGRGEAGDDLAERREDEREPLFERELSPSGR